MRTMMRNRKGQTAMEAILLTVLILASVTVIGGRINNNTRGIDEALRVRLAMQAIAMDLSMSQDKHTDVIRIDPVPGGQYRVWVVSEDCDANTGAPFSIREWSDDNGDLIAPDGVPGADGIQCKRLFYNQILP